MAAPGPEIMDDSLQSKELCGINLQELTETIWKKMGGFILSWNVPQTHLASIHDD
jgi:hypothetical protein